MHGEWPAGGHQHHAGMYQMAATESHATRWATLPGFKPGTAHLPSFITGGDATCQRKKYPQNLRTSVKSSWPGLGTAKMKEVDSRQSDGTNSVSVSVRVANLPMRLGQKPRRMVEELALHRRGALNIAPPIIPYLF